MSKNVTRRGFAKLGAMGALAAAIGGGGVTACSYSPEEARKNLEKYELKGACHQCKQGGCSVIYTVENGVVTNIHGNPESKLNVGHNCGRSYGAIMNLYNPRRIKAPMKRTNPVKSLTDDPGWVEISWDEAISTAASKLKEAHDKDPRGIMWWYGFSGADVAYWNGRENLVRALFDTPNVSSTKGQFCAVHYALGTMYNNGPSLNADYMHCHYMVSIGRETGVTASYAQGGPRAFTKAVEKNNLRHVVIDPLMTTEASMGEWVPIIPGSDAAFVYSVLYLMLIEYNRYDKEFMRQHTNAPYLIDANGDYIRGGNGKPMMWDTRDGAAKEFDDPTMGFPALDGEPDWTVNGQPVRTCMDAVKEAVKNFTPEWQQDKTGIAPAKVRQIVTDLLDEDCIGQTITIDGEELPYRPSVFMNKRGSCNHEDGSWIDIACKMVNELLGNVYVVGGTSATNSGVSVLKPDSDGMIPVGGEAKPCSSFNWPPEHFDLEELFPHRHSTNTVAIQVLKEGPEKWGIDIKPEVLYCMGGSPFCSTTMNVVEGMTKIPYIITSCYHFDELAWLSDLLLAEPAQIERSCPVYFLGDESTTTCEPGFSGNRGYMWRNGIEPLYEGREPNQVFMDIVEKMGMMPKFNELINKMGAFQSIGLTESGAGLSDEYKLDPNTVYTFEEIVDRGLKSYFGADRGLDYLKERSFIFPYGFDRDVDVYNSVYNKQYRHQFYLMSQKLSGDFLLGAMDEKGVDPAEVMKVDKGRLRKYYGAVPFYDEDTYLKHAPEEYDLYACTMRHPLFIFRMALQDANPIAFDWAETYDNRFNAIIVNPQVAEAKGLKTGDHVRVKSEFGQTEGKLLVTPGVQPQTVGFCGGTGRLVDTLGEQAKNAVFFNALLSGELGHLNPIHGGFDVTARVKIEKLY